MTRNFERPPLQGDAGNDTYRFSRSFGHDIIYNYDGGANRHDRIEFTDLNPSDITLRREGINLILRTQEGDQITVNNHFNHINSRIDEVRFADGSVLDAQALARVIQRGTDRNDKFTATEQNPVLYGGNGNDTLTGHSGNDELHGETGSDILTGFAGHDTLHGGEDNDHISGGEGNDRLNGDEGNDYLQGGNGDDLLQGGTGNDILIGNEGNDTYRFSRGFGQDVIYNHDRSANRHDRIEFTDLNRADITVYREQNMLVLRTQNGDRITVQNHFYNDKHQIDEIVFADGSSLSVQEIAALVLQSTDGNDILTASAENHVLYGGGGSDRLIGHTGDDELHGETGNDHLRGFAGNDTLMGGEGDDMLYGNEGNDRLLGQAGNDHIRGGSGNDTLAGGQGRDYLHGEADDDLYIYRTGDGYDHILDSSGNDTLYLPDFSTEQFLQHASRSGNHLQLRIDVDNSLTLQDMFSTDHGIEHIALSDGATLNITQIYQHFGERYTGNGGAYDANRVLDDFNKINGIIG